MHKTWIAAWMFAMALAACARRETDGKDRVYQSSPRDSTAATIPWSDLETRGDFGMGRIGEDTWILLEGDAHRVEGGRVVGRIPAETPVASALLTFFERDRSYDVSDMEFAVFKNTLDWKRPAPGRIYALRVDGLFQRIVFADGREQMDTRGTILGFHYPDYLDAVRAPGYELYFMNEDRSQAGAVQSFSIRQARIDLDECSSLLLDLPEKR